MVLHCISPLGGIIFVVVLSHFIFLNFKRYTFDFVKSLILNFFHSNFRSTILWAEGKVLTNSPKFNSSVPGEELWDRNFIELVETSNYHYITVLCPQPNFLDYDDLLKFTFELINLRLN